MPKPALAYPATVLIKVKPLAVAADSRAALQGPPGLRIQKQGRGSFDSVFMNFPPSSRG